MWRVFKLLSLKDLFSLRKQGAGVGNGSTVIGQSALIEGQLISHEIVQLRGRVLGNIEVTGGPQTQLIVLRQAEVTGDIRAEQAHVNGQVSGNIDSDGQVQLQANARVNGNISYRSMVIEHGAKLFGLMSPHGHK